MVNYRMAANEFEHFLEAQAPVYEQIIEELSAGKKRSHWMWFIFPQLKGLGFSPMARQYAIESLEQARRYAADPVLGQRLRQCTQVVNQTHGRDISDIFDYPDDLKFHSSMTLFAQAADEPAFKLALDKYFGSETDEKTLGMLRKMAPRPKET
jgi:uncharacterized protein (DUF1810 family)